MEEINATEEASSPPPAIDETSLGSIRHGFQVGDMRLLIAPGTYSELISRPSVCAIPDTPDALLGFINHRGDTLPVWDLQRFITPFQAGFGRWLLLLGEGRQAFAVLLNSYPQGLTRLQPQPDSVPPDVLQPFVGSAHGDENAIWWEFDHQRFCNYVRQRFAAAS